MDLFFFTYLYRSLLVARTKKVPAAKISTRICSSVPKATMLSCSTHPTRGMARVCLTNVRYFSKGDFSVIHSKVLGHGVFGKCFLGSIGSQQACIKMFRPGQVYQSSMKNEAFMLSQCCHPNIPLLFGMCFASEFNALALSYHGMNGISCSIHSLVCTKNASKLTPGSALTSDEWKGVILGSMEGLSYLHHHPKDAVLHNDLKEDNIVVENP